MYTTLVFHFQKLRSQNHSQDQKELKQKNKELMAALRKSAGIEDKDSEPKQK